MLPRAGCLCTHCRAPVSASGTSGCLSDLFFSVSVNLRYGDQLSCFAHDHPDFSPEALEPGKTCSPGKTRSLGHPRPLTHRWGGEGLLQALGRLSAESGWASPMLCCLILAASSGGVPVLIPQQRKRGEISAVKALSAGLRARRSPG